MVRRVTYDADFEESMRTGMFFSMSPLTPEQIDLSGLRPEQIERRSDGTAMVAHRNGTAMEISDIHDCNYGTNPMREWDKDEWLRFQPWSRSFDPAYVKQCGFDPESITPDTDVTSVFSRYGSQFCYDAAGHVELDTRDYNAYVIDANAVTEYGRSRGYINRAVGDLTAADMAKHSFEASIPSMSSPEQIRQSSQRVIESGFGVGHRHIDNRPVSTPLPTAGDKSAHTGITTGRESVVDNEPVQASDDAYDFEIT